MNLGHKLKGLRLKTKKTLFEQSRLLGVSMNSIYRWENNLTTPRKPTLQKMADFYSVPVEWLVSESASASLVNGDEMDLLGMFRKLPSMNKYKVLGYVERMSIEDRIEEF